MWITARFISICCVKKPRHSDLHSADANPGFGKEILEWDFCAAYWESDEGAFEPVSGMITLDKVF